MLMTLLLCFVMLISVACKKRDLSVRTDNSMPDTSYVSLDTPTDSTSNTDFNLTGYDTPPSPVRNPMPVYPVSFRKSGIQGVVVLDVEVLADGTVGKIDVTKSLLANEGGLDDTAVAAVKSWIFKPALLDKKPVTSHVNVPIPFSLKSNN